MDISLLDKLLGRADLKNQIDMLEKEVQSVTSEKEELQQKIEKLSKAKSKAITEKQRAYEKRNKTQDKLEQLEDTIQQLQKTDSTTEQEYNNTTVKYKNTEEVYKLLDQISYADRKAITFTIEDGNEIPELLSGFDLHTENISKGDLVLVGKYGLIRHSLDIPIPPEHRIRHEEKSFSINPVNFYPQGKIIFCLIRSDIFAVAEYNGWNKKDITTLSSKVESNHSKGGFSQSRFANRRNEQISDHITKVKEIIENIDEDNCLTVAVGEKSMVKELEEWADRIDTSDATGPPENAINKAFRDFWTIEIKPL